MRFFLSRRDARRYPACAGVDANLSSAEGVMRPIYRLDMEWCQLIVWGWGDEQVGTTPTNLQGYLAHKKPPPPLGPP